MAPYRALQSNSPRVTLEGAAGRRQVGRALEDAPVLGAEFHGPHAARGFAILSNASTERRCRVILEEIDCGLRETWSGLRLQ